VVEHLLCKCEALSSKTLVLPKKKKEEEYVDIRIHRYIPIRHAKYVSTKCNNLV
jgi:hypothetical protein